MDIVIARWLDSNIKNKENKSQPVFPNHALIIFLF